MAASLAQKGSVSEELFPFLMAALEACLVNMVCVELANMGFLGSTDVLFPLWLPFLLIASACWIIRYPTRRLLHAFPELKQDIERRSPPLIALCLLLGLLELLFVVCSSQYTPLSLDASNVFQTSYLAIGGLDIWRLIAVILVAGFLCWRGGQIARAVVDSQQIKWLLGVGLGIVVVFIVVRGFQEIFYQRQLPHDDVAFFFLLTLCAGVSLFAYPLAQRAYLFRFHANDIRESFRRQEYLFLALLACFCLLALVLLWWVIALHNHWLVLQLLSPAKTDSSGKTYIPPFSPPKGGSGSGSPPLLAASFWLKIILLISLVGIVVFLLVRLIRRLLTRLPQEEDETHESLWSWSLFWQQLKAVAAALFARLVPIGNLKRMKQREEALVERELPIRTIRQLYSVFLRHAAHTGYARTHSETPNEYRERLNTHLSFTEPYLGELTDAYVASRYGEYHYDEAEMARLREIWRQLQQQWQGNTSKKEIQK